MPGERRRRVVRSELFLETARELYPPGGTAAGQPSFELFEARLLRAVEEQFAREFEEQLEVPGTGIRLAATHDVPLFPAMVFYAVLTTDDTVELVGLTVDDDYFDLIADDPED